MYNQLTRQKYDNVYVLVYSMRMELYLSYVPVKSGDQHVFL